MLIVQIVEPESGAKFLVMVHHAKTRSGGRAATDNRREGAANGEISIDGWRLRDRAGHEKTLSGSIAAGQEQEVSLEAGELPLNNSGDDVILTDADGATIHPVSYTGAQSGTGAIISFGN